MPRARTLSVLALLVVVPVWLVTSRAAAGPQWRLTLLSIIHRPLQWTQETLAATGSVFRAPVLRAENQQLRRALLARQHEVIRTEELTQEVARLSKLLQLKQEIGRPTAVARVIGRDATPWFRTILLDLGRAAGVEEGAAVVVEGGLVGQVYELGPAVTRVLLLNDPRFRVGALVQRSRAQGIAVGTASGRCYLAYLTSAEVVQVGDLIVTSGVGGVIPKGLVIGSVVRVEQDPSGLYWQALLKPSIDPWRVEEVLCFK